MPDPIARPCSVAIRRVDLVAQSRSDEACTEFLREEMKKRSHDGSVDRLDSSQTFEPRAEEEPQENRLGLIVEVMGGRHVPCSDRLPVLLQEGVALPSRFGFESARRLVAGARLEGMSTLDLEGDAETLGRRGRRLGTVARLLVETVVQMRRMDLDSQPRAHLVQPPQEGRRVRPAREGYKNPVARVDRSLVPEESCERFCRRHGGGEGTRTPDAADMSRLLYRLSYTA